MNASIYFTSLDGMKTISTTKEISSNDYVLIQDELFQDECTLFKNKQTIKHTVDLKLVKLAETKTLSVEEQANYKFNQLYSFKELIFTSTNRLNKNQLIELKEYTQPYYVVEDIIKHNDKPLELILSAVAYKEADNVYTILQTCKKTLHTEVYERYTSYGEALKNMNLLREKQDGFFYRFP